MLAHHALGLTGGAGGEVDVGELVGVDADTQIAVGMVFLVDGIEVEPLDSGQRLERTVERRRAAAFGQHEPAAGPGEHPRDAIGREMGLDRQVRAAGLEDPEHCSHPVQVALGHHGDDAFAAESSRQQGSCQLIGTAVELPVGPVTVAVHGRDGVRVCADALLD